MNLRFWKKGPSLSISRNIKRRRSIHLCAEVLGFALLEFSILGLTITITVQTVVMAILIVGSIVWSLVSSSQAKKARGGYGRDSMNSGHLINTRSASEPVVIPYGDCRVGGNIVYVNSTGTNNDYLHIVMTLGEGPVEGIVTKTYETLTLDVAPAAAWKANDKITGATSGESCYIVKVLTTKTFIIRDRTGAFTLDEILSNGTYTADQGAANPVVSESTADGAQIWLDDKLVAYYGTDVTYQFYNGTGSQGVCTALQTVDTNWNDAMHYTAYLYIKLHYNEDLFASMPQITVRLLGRKLYDPRNKNTVYSNNPALVAYDFLRNERYSIGFPASAFDEASFIDVANWADTNTYTFNGSIINYQAFLDNLDDILKNFRAGIVWSEGEYKLVVYEYDTPVMTLTEDEIVEDSFRIIVPGIPETPNRVVINYIDAVDNYLSKQRIIEDVDSVLSYDKEERDFGLDLIGTTNATQAEKLGTYYVERNRLNYQFSFSCAARALALEPLDMVTITHYLPGWTAAILRVVDVKYTQGDHVQLTVIQDDSDLYDDVVNVATHNAFTTNLPVASNYPAVSTVQGLPGLLSDPQNALSFQLLAADPGAPTEGQVWFNTTDNHFKGYDGAAVVQLDN